ncbi:hypothetical protein LTR10_019766 [Elasticomyces elasticus]|uniref:Xylose isomerase-like TIM barrel domain-containing protein n=1 Tax=Exophiala sideris TaxID=1016849 RepID=A0ABR0JCG9_9EURO|nr:hypothetical protein LTR10_019766 [Elasticomyces elasticus]KAK5032107.1 hypothetical protein LTS07_004729 [Exophiala sideris]KAK5041034.1 hypothetical protein LTR13_003336 [Exophiala sideris]KAK5061632.1 hypothetical protein LTR69_004814 [Exophiala sideris]KAK5184331.1 hypothetical protein LTR44_003004 [Eurotiomycetes sp. CCFEE 6388]
MPFLPAIASPSLGHPSVHSIERRLKEAAAQGFRLIEVVEDDLKGYAQGQDGGNPDTHMMQAAGSIKSLCDNLGIKPFVLQPFWQYEGLLDREEHKARIEKLRLWMKLVKILDVQLIQIPTTWLTEGTTGDMDVIVQDFLELAEIGLQQEPMVSFAYEGVAWGTYIDTWEGTWEVVKRVNKPNFGLCLDTYHIAARIWGDPTTSTCKRQDGDLQLQKSMEQLIREVDVNKVFYVQAGDAEKLAEPLVAGHPFHSDAQLPRMSWSRNARLFAFEKEQDGCLPIEPILNAIVHGLNFRGYLSVETFSRELFSKDDDLPARYAARGMRSWDEILKRLRIS